MPRRRSPPNSASRSASAAPKADGTRGFPNHGGLWLEEIFAGNYTLGTVAVEILIYLAYPLFFFLAAAGRWRLLGGIAVGLHGIALLLQPFINPFVLFSGILVMALFWYLGALAAHLRHQRAWIVRGRWIAMAWAVFLTLKAVPHFYGRNLLKQAAWGLVCMLAIVWLLDWERAHAGWRDRLLSRIMRYCGDLSYSLYAVHTPVIFLVTWTMLTVFEIRSYSWQLLASFGLCLLISVAVHHGIEKKFYRPQARAIPPLPSS
jgi:peptidoglycan/LPS O-acetylase OafA/YrhL